MGRKITTPFGVYWEDANGNRTPYTGQDQQQPQTQAQAQQAPAPETTPTPAPTPTIADQLLMPPQRNIDTGTVGQAGAAFNYNNPTQPAALTQALASNTSSPTAAPGGGVPAPVPAPTIPPPGNLLNDTVNIPDSMDPNNLPPVPQISHINLPQNPQVNPLFSPDETINWQQILQGGQTDLANQFDNYQKNVPTMQAAQIDTAGIPQPQAQQVGSNAALDFLMSGQGFSPQTLALMRGQATDTATRNAAGQRGSANMALQNAGLQDSGIGMALLNQNNRRTGDTINAAQNQISLNNAQAGLENTRLAAPLELQRGTTNANSANQMALDNAARLFAGMQQNVSNSQAANQTNTTNQNAMLQNRANTIGGYTATEYANRGNAAQDRANQADFTNNSNTINRNLNQANLDRSADVFNTQTGENRYNNIPSWLNALNGVPSGSSTAVSAANLNGLTNPNFIAANGYQNIGTSLINAATQH